MVLSIPPSSVYVGEYVLTVLILTMSHIPLWWNSKHIRFLPNTLSSFSVNIYILKAKNERKISHWPDLLYFRVNKPQNDVLLSSQHLAHQVQSINIKASYKSELQTVACIEEYITLKCFCSRGNFRKRLDWLAHPKRSCEYKSPGEVVKM